MSYDDDPYWSDWSKTKNITTDNTSTNINKDLPWQIVQDPSIARDKNITEKLDKIIQLLQALVNYNEDSEYD